MTTFNHKPLVWAFNNSAFTINGLAGRLDVSNDIVEAILRGTGTLSDLRLSTLITLGDILGVPLYAMFTKPDLGEADPNTAEGPDRDAEQLIACLHDRGNQRTYTTDVAAALHWTFDRLTAAIGEADHRLRPAGFRIYRTSGLIKIATLRDHSPLLKRLAETETAERGLSLRQYRAVHQLLTTGEITATNSKFNRHLIVGALAHQGIATEKIKPALTDEVLEGML